MAWRLENVLGVLLFVICVDQPGGGTPAGSNQYIGLVELEARLTSRSATSANRIFLQHTIMRQLWIVSRFVADPLSILACLGFQSAVDAGLMSRRMGRHGVARSPERSSHTLFNHRVVKGTVEHLLDRTVGLKRPGQ